MYSRLGPLKLGRIFIILAFTCVVFGASTQGNGQTISQNTTPLQSGLILLQNYKGKIWTLDAQTGNKQLLADIMLRADKVTDVQANTATQQLYVLESAGYGGGVWLGNSYVIKVDLPTVQERIVYKGVNVFQMHISPNMHNALLSYYPSNLQRIRSDDLYYTCVLNFDTGECTQVGEIGREATWLRDDLIVWENRERDMYLIDLPTFKQIKLPIRLIDMELIRTNPNQAVISQASDAKLFRLDLTTMDVTPYAPSIELADLKTSPYGLKFSPDGKYLLFRDNAQYYIIDLDAHKEIAKPRDLGLLVRWLPNSQSLITIISPTPGKYPNNIVRYDIAAEHFENLISLDEPIVISIAK